MHSRSTRRNAVLVVLMVTATLTGQSLTVAASPSSPSSPSPPASLSAAKGDRSVRMDPRAERAAFGARGNPLASSSFVGIDGATHQRSPLVVRGRKGTVFFGEDLDAACGYGPMFGQGLRRLARLARTIKRSGRRVVFTVAPNKTSVMGSRIRRGRLPHGHCDLTGLAQQNRALDRFADRRYVPLRRTLVNRFENGSPHLFWPIDTHWTRIGAQAWVEALAARLDPALAERQRSRRGTERIETDLSYLGVIPKTTEKGPAVYPTTPVTVVSKPRYDPRHRITFRHTWRTKPAGRAWPGRTLLIGDSFTYRALDPLMTLFAKGEFIWYGQPETPSIPDAIERADTVVIEMVQRFVPIAPLTSPELLADVRSTLRAARSHARAGRS